jgi:hypothetical protein
MGSSAVPSSSQEVSMKGVFRAVAVSMVLSLAWAGPLAPLATAQQPASPPAETAAAPPAPERRGIDVYDVGAVAVTALGFPFKVAICGLGIAMSTVVFTGSFAARPDAAVGVLEEGCGSKARWIVRGNDIRPQSSATKAFEWETHRFRWER